MRKLIIALLMISPATILNAQDSLTNIALNRIDTREVSRIANCPEAAVSHAHPENRILNSLFTLGQQGQVNFSDPFPSVNFWTRSHGTPQLNVYATAPATFPTGSNSASMWANGTGGEGIIGNLGGANYTVPAIQNGMNYVLSFYRAVSPNIASPAAQLDRINIILVKCADLMSSTNVSIPTIPTNSQQIYCETNIATATLAASRVVVEFTANDDYDLIWIFPQQLTTFGQAWLNIAMPELSANFARGRFDINNFDLYLGLGPQFFNTVHNWYDQNNSLLTSYNLDGPTYDAYTNIPLPSGLSYGPITQVPGSPLTYNFTMSFPNAIATNNTCSTPFTGTLTYTPFVWRGTSSSEIVVDMLQRNVVRVVSKTEDQDCKIYVYDLSGRIICLLGEQLLKHGTNDYTLQIPSTAKGIYILKIVSKSQTYSKKIFLRD